MKDAPQFLLGMVLKEVVFLGLVFLVLTFILLMFVLHYFTDDSILVQVFELSMGQSVLFTLELCLWSTEARIFVP